jgi:hypothetical protein
MRCFFRVKWRCIQKNTVVIADYLTYIIEGYIFGQVEPETPENFGLQNSCIKISGGVALTG